MTVQATLIHAPGDIRLETVPDPVLSTGGDAIVRVVAACVCGSDLWPYRGVDADQARRTASGTSSSASSRRSAPRSSASASATS